MEEATKEVLSRHCSLHGRKLKPWEDHDLLKGPELMMGLGPELRASNSLSSAPATQVGLGGEVEELSGELGRAAKQELTFIKCFNTYKALLCMSSHSRQVQFSFCKWGSWSSER